MEISNTDRNLSVFVTLNKVISFTIVKTANTQLNLNTMVDWNFRYRLILGYLSQVYIIKLLTFLYHESL
jgi:hypothetical protein